MAFWRFESLEQRTCFGAYSIAAESITAYYLEFQATFAEQPFENDDHWRLTFGRKGTATIEDIGPDGKVSGADPCNYAYSPGPYGRDQITISATQGSVTIAVDLGLTFGSPYGGDYDLVYHYAGNYTSTQHGTFLAFPKPGVGTIRGAVWDDTDGNGKWGGAEQPLLGVRVFLDRNGNGKWDSTERSRMTGDDGRYAFKDINSGYHKVRTEIVPGHRASKPSTGMQRITLLPATAVDGKNFGQTPRPLIAGKSLIDTNGDGVGDQRGNVVYIDANNNGDWMGPERDFTPDSKGNWSIADLDPGVYYFRVDLLGNDKVAAPAKGYYKIQLEPGQILTGIDFVVSRKL